MYQCFKRSTIKPGQGNKKIREIISQKREIRKRMTQIDPDCPLYMDLKEKLNQKVEEIALEHDKERADKMKQRLDRIQSRGCDKRNEIWKIRKRATTAKEPKLAIKSANGKLLTEKDDILARYNEYYTELLKPRTPQQQSMEYIKEMESNFEICIATKIYDDEEINSVFTMIELEAILKDTKPGKCPGPDETQSEIWIHAGTNLKISLLKMINAMWLSEEIPEPLRELDVKSMYKGKGCTAELKNQRGIFLGNEVLKIYEKLISKRTRTKMERKISECQAGGRPSRNIADQIFILRSVWNQYAYLNKGLYLQFLDLIKAFDKMVLKAVLLDLWECDIKGRIWRNIYHINKASTLRIKTPFGRSEKFEIDETLKQGSVLATALAALHTDSVSKLFDNKGLNINYGNLKINNLLFQDDILRIQTNAGDMNKSNKLYEVFQHNNRMEFHQDKSVCISTKDKDPIYLNNRELKFKESYKYLGDIFTYNNSYNLMIETRISAVRGATAELCAILAEIPKNMKLDAIISYYHAIITPKLLLNGETWNNLSVKNIKDLETSQNVSIKRLLQMPITTPNDILRSEVGLWRIENQLIYKKLVYLQRILKQKNNVTRKVLMEQMNLP